MNIRRVAFFLFAGILAVPALAEEMIQIDVQVLELNKSKMIKAGIDWTRLLEGAPGAGIPSGAEIVEQAPAPLKRFGTFERGRIDAFLRLIQTNNYGKLLAKPKLLTVSGAQASFLVGGELPVVSQDTQGHTSVTWKEYGVKLLIKPERKDAVIRTHVRAEASTVDAGTAVTLPNGTYMPGMKTRWAETDVELPPHSTVTMAGLIQSQDVKVSSGLPVLCDIPLLGWFFRHTRTETQETELVIFVTPELVSPQAGAGGI